MTGTSRQLDLARNRVAIEFEITQSLLSVVGTHLFVGTSSGPLASRSDELIREAVGNARAHFVELCRLANAFEETRASSAIAIEAAQEYRCERGPA
jgi:hypothetical protein